jgi:hypothetical protein
MEGTEEQMTTNAETTSSLLVRREWSEEEHAFLAKADLAQLAPVETWAITASNQRLGYATHGIYRYFGKFPPPVASHLIQEFTSPGDIVIDPTCGSGTTGVEAAIAGRRCLLADINPLALLLASVKTLPLPIFALDEAIRRVQATYMETPSGTFWPEGLRNVEHWFLPETISSLQRLRHAVDVEPDGPIKDFLNVSFAAVVRRSSRATTQQGRLFLDVNSAHPDALPLFIKHAEKAAARVAALPPSDVTIECRDLREPMQSAQMAPLVIVHPPYFNAYRYSSVNSLEMAWLGYDIKDVRRNEIREYFKVARTHNVETYIDDMSRALANAANMTTKGGVVALMMGDTTLGGQHVHVVRPLLDKLPDHLAVDRIALRTPKFTEATWATSQRRTSGKLGVKMFDFIVIMKRT